MKQGGIIMKVEITEAKHVNAWYYNKIGEVFEVIP